MIVVQVFTAKNGSGFEAVRFILEGMGRILIYTLPIVWCIWYVHWSRDLRVWSWQLKLQVLMFRTFSTSAFSCRPSVSIEDSRKKHRYAQKGCPYKNCKKWRMIRKGMRGMMLMLNLLRKMPQKFQFNPGMKSPSSTSILQALHAPLLRLVERDAPMTTLKKKKKTCSHCHRQWLFLELINFGSGVSGLNWFNVQVTFNFVTWFPYCFVARCQ